MSDLIKRADAIDAMCSNCLDRDVCTSIIGTCDSAKAVAELPSADAVSREEYEETDGVVKIKKQSAKEVGEIKHIVVCSPNYTRYFYNESMPIQYKGGDDE